MARNHRLHVDPSTNLPNINTFGELSEFLRDADTDEESRRFSESMGQLAARVEAIVVALRASHERAAVAPMLVDMLTVLRAHRQFVVSLGLAWRGLYEYASYLQALNNMRVLIGQWLLEGGADSAEIAVSAQDFEFVAWRTLGDGMLLIDMYEQWVSQQMGQQEADTVPQPSTLGAPEGMHVQRALQWWRKLRL